ncbi:MAG: alpha-amylase [Actinobacteria bacterium]|nr:MAG: alpha-amylase [Actinomycetota bacterium]
MLAEWLRGRTVYHVHVLRAVAERGLPALASWLDHVAALGCGAVLLTPVHESSNHGYDTVDALRLDPRLGSDADLDRFVAECRARDVRVFFDGVFNHAGRAFRRPEWLSERTWEGHDELPTLDHDNPEVLSWAVEVACHWLDRGGDGWRFDVAYALPRPFLRSLTSAVRAVRPDAFLFGEAIHGDYAGLARETGLDGVTQYELFKAIWSSLNDANLWELAWALDRHGQFAQSFTPVTFVGNHDVNRIATNLADPAHLELALAVLFTVPGVPCVYYGDELGWTGAKGDGAGADDEIRPALPESPPQHAATDQHRRWINFRRSRPWLTDAAIEVISKTNHRLQYQVADAVVTIDLDNGVQLDGFD